MRQVSNLALLLVQWLLVLWGLMLIAITLNTFVVEYRYFADLPAAAPGQSSYSPPIFHRLTVGIGTGLCAIGLGAALFYLRRIYLSRQANSTGL
ncbi:MAG: hypothetical protein AAFV31_14220 [Pseudomonadota bacterium]